MVRIRCEEITVDDRQSLKDWLANKQNVSIEKEVSEKSDAALFHARDKRGKKVSIFPTSLTEKSLHRLGCQTPEEAMCVLRDCRLFISSDREELICDAVNLPYCVELPISDIPDQISSRRNHSDFKFGSPKDAIDRVDVKDQTDCAYSHIPVRIGEHTKYFDLREAAENYFLNLGIRYGRDVESYYRSLVLWTDTNGTLPFQRINDSTLMLPLPPPTTTILREFRFSSRDMVDGDAIAPSMQFGSWEFCEPDVYVCMAFRGQPFVHDSSKRKTRRLILWEDLTEEAFHRMLAECSWPKEKPNAFQNSFRCYFGSTRCMFTFCESSNEWSVMVPQSVYTK